MWGGKQGVEAGVQCLTCCSGLSIPKPTNPMQDHPTFFCNRIKGAVVFDTARGVAFQNCLSVMGFIQESACPRPPRYLMSHMFAHVGVT